MKYYITSNCVGSYSLSFGIDLYLDQGTVVATFYKKEDADRACALLNGVATEPYKCPDCGMINTAHCCESILEFIDEEAHKEPMIAVSEVSRLIVRARKNVLSDWLPVEHKESNIIEFCFNEIRHLLQLRRRSRVKARTQTQ